VSPTSSGGAAEGHPAATSVFLRRWNPVAARPPIRLVRILDAIERTVTPSSPVECNPDSVDAANLAGPTAAAGGQPA